MRVEGVHVGAENSGTKWMDPPTAAVAAGLGMFHYRLDVFSSGMRPIFVNAFCHWGPFESVRVGYGYKSFIPNPHRWRHPVGLSQFGTESRASWPFSGWSSPDRVPVVMIDQAGVFDPASQRPTLRRVLRRLGGRSIIPCPYSLIPYHRHMTST